MYIEGWLLNQAGDWIFFDGSVLSGSLLPYQKVLQSQSKTPQHSQRRFYTRSQPSNPFVLIYPQPGPQIPTTNRLSSLFVPFSTLHWPDVVCKPTPSFKLNLTVSICSTACDSARSQRTIFVQPQYVIRADVLKRPFQDFVRRRSWHWASSNFPPRTFWRSEWKGKTWFQSKKVAKWRMEENGSWSANLKTMSKFCNIFPSILLFFLALNRRKYVFQAWQTLNHFPPARWFPREDKA